MISRVAVHIRASYALRGNRTSPITWLLYYIPHNITANSIFIFFLSQHVDKICYIIYILLYAYTICCLGNSLCSAGVGHPANPDIDFDILVILIEVRATSPRDTPLYIYNVYIGTYVLLYIGIYLAKAFTVDGVFGSLAFFKGPDYT